MLSASRALRLRFERAESAFPLLLPAWSPAVFRHRSLRFAFTIILIALLVGTFWIVVKKEPQIKQEITRRLSPKRATSQPTPMETHHVTTGSDPHHQETPPPLPEHAAGSLSALPIALQPNNRETPPSVSLSSADYELIQFELTVERQSASRSTVEVLASQGQSIYVGTAERDSAATMKFAAPRWLFQTGEFEIRLIDENGKTVETYYFRVE